MEQVFAAFGIEWQLLLAQAVNFAIVLVALTYFLYKPLMKMLGERQEKIAQGIKDAEAAAAARVATDAEKAGILAVAEAEAQEVAARATAEGKSEREKLVRSGEERAEAILKDAEAQAEEARRRALAESESEIARAAVLAAEKILRKS